MIFTLLILPFLKILSSLASVAFTSGIKKSKDVKEYKTHLKRIEKEIAKGGRARQLYGNDPITYMDLHYPKTISFKTEFILNAHRPLLILYSITLWTQLNYPIAVMTVFLWGSFYFVEEHIEELKTKKWYIGLLITIWIISLPLLIWSESKTRGIYICSFF